MTNDPPNQMIRIAILASMIFFVGATLALSELRWFRRKSLADRLRLYSAGTHTANLNSGSLSVATFAQIIGPLARSIGEMMSSVTGTGDELAARLTRVHSAYDVTTFRVRQLGFAVAGGVGGALASVAIGAVGASTIVLTLIGATLSFLLVEQRLTTESKRRQERIFHELPVVAEQLGMLLAAGFSLGSAIGRVAERGNGACAQDLRMVNSRIRHGLTEIQALREWATIADVDALHRLTGILALNRDTGDLGRLINDEARSIRREAQRRLMETIEKRSQQVWVPVTVATLIPGVIFLAIPFIDALSLFGQT